MHHLQHVAMDSPVLASIARWPNVPDVYGWLALSARGQWRLRGEPIGNAAIREFIGRNYAADPQGRWYFQNGPQRVFVALELAPWVYRLHPGGPMRTFTGNAPRRLLGAALVDGANFVVLTELGAGSIDDRDAGLLLEALVDERGRPLDDAALDRVLIDGAPAWLHAGRCGLIGPPEPLQRLGVDELGAAFRYQRTPVPG